MLRQSAAVRNALEMNSYSTAGVQYQYYWCAVIVALTGGEYRTYEENHYISHTTKSYVRLFVFVSFLTISAQHYKICPASRKTPFLHLPALWCTVYLITSLRCLLWRHLRNYVDSITYASLIYTLVYIHPSGGIIYCKSMLIGGVMYNAALYLQ